MFGTWETASPSILSGWALWQLFSPYRDALLLLVCSLLFGSTEVKISDGETYRKDLPCTHI